MKLLLCIVIVALCVYAGRLFSKRASQRLEFFREYNSAIVYISDRIVGLNLELCRAIDLKGDSPLRGFLGDCSTVLKTSPQKRFKSIWKRSFDNNLSSLGFLSKDDIRLICDGGEAIETLCMNPSEKQAEGYVKRLAAYVNEMETEKRKKCKLYNTVGILSGLFIALLII